MIRASAELPEFYKPPGVILLRLKDESIENKIKVVSFVVTSYGEAILGNIMVVSEKKIRLRGTKIKIEVHVKITKFYYDSEIKSNKLKSF